MKTFRMIGMALLAVVMCVNFASCSDDDEDGGGSNSIVGFWKIISQDGIYIGDDDNDSSYLEFTKDNEIIPYDSNKQYHNGALDGKTFYTVSGSSLQIDWNCSGSYSNHRVDDATVGTFKIDGARLTYTCHWETGDDEEEGDIRTCTLILEKAQR